MNFWIAPSVPTACGESASSISVSQSPMNPAPITTRLSGTACAELTAGTRAAAEMARIQRMAAGLMEHLHMKKHHVCTRNLGCRVAGAARNADRYAPRRLRSPQLRRDDGQSAIVIDV